MTCKISILNAICMYQKLTMTLMNRIKLESLNSLNDLELVLFPDLGYLCVLTNTSKDKVKCVYRYFYDKPNVCNVFCIGNKKYLKRKDDWSTSSYASQTRPLS